MFSFNPMLGTKPLKPTWEPRWESLAHRGHHSVFSSASASGNGNRSSTTIPTNNEKRIRLTEYPREHQSRESCTWKCTYFLTTLVLWHKLRKPTTNTPSIQLTWGEYSSTVANRTCYLTVSGFQEIHSFILSFFFTFSCRIAEQRNTNSFNTSLMKI